MFNEHAIDLPAPKDLTFSAFRELAGYCADVAGLPRTATFLSMTDNEGPLATEAYLEYESFVEPAVKAIRNGTPFAHAKPAEFYEFISESLADAVAATANVLQEAEEGVSYGKKVFEVTDDWVAALLEKEGM